MWLAATYVPASAQEPTFFYHGYDYGSQATFSPLTAVLVKGYDALQFVNLPRDVTRMKYGRAATNVAYALRNPIEVIEDVGWSRFIRAELLPLTWNSGASWLPNYVEHFAAGGATYVAIKEWFEERGVRGASWYAGFTTWGAAYLNEISENGGGHRGSADSVADLFIFDLGGILVFTWDAIPRLFVSKLGMMDWSMQPIFLPATGELVSAGQYMAYRIKVPLVSRTYIFMRAGMGGYFGLTLRVGEETFLSVGFGKETEEQVVQNPETAPVYSITAARSGGIFWDRKGSLMASLTVSKVHRNAAILNVYPGVLPGRAREVGLVAIFSRDGEVRVGISSSRLLGVGLGHVF